jgi:hypothetical protein
MLFSMKASRKRAVTRQESTIRETKQRQAITGKKLTERHLNAVPLITLRIVTLIYLRDLYWNKELNRVFASKPSQGLAALIIFARPSLQCWPLYLILCRLGGEQLLEQARALLQLKFLDENFCW